MASTHHLKGVSRSLGETFISRNNGLAGYCASHDPSIESPSNRAEHRNSSFMPIPPGSTHTPQELS